MTDWQFWLLMFPILNLAPEKQKWAHVVKWVCVGISLFAFTITHGGH